MKFPSKVTNYSNSFFNLSLRIFKEINNPIKIIELIKLLKLKTVSISEIIDGLTFLYAINKIKINENGEIEKC